MSFHAFTRFIRVTFFNGVSLKPPPPRAGKDPDSRRVDIHEDVGLDEERMADRVREAAALPGRAKAPPAERGGRSGKRRAS